MNTPREIAKLITEDLEDNRGLAPEAEKPEATGSHQYERAGRNAPPGVQKAVEEFHQLPEEQKASTPLLYYILGDSTPAYKMSQEDSEYTDKSTVEGQTCKNCEFAYQKVVSGKYICSQIAGEIQPPGWCKLWKSHSK